VTNRTTQAEPTRPRSQDRRPAVGRHVVISSFDSVSNTHYGGGGAVIVERIARWLAADFEVTVVTAGRRGGTAVRDGVHYRELPASWAGPRAGQLLYHALLPFAARQISADLWIENFTPPFSTSFLPLFARTRVLGLAQNLSGKEMWGRYRLPFFLLERLGLRFYRDVIVLNRADRDVVGRYSPRAKVQVIPECVDLPPIEEGEIGRGDYILFLGRIDMWQKGIDLLLEAHAQSRLAMPLIIAGSGTPSDERKLATMLPTAGGNIRWVGRVTGERKQGLLERCAFMVLPSRHEGFGISALEGMSYGKPVLHFDLPELRWMEGDVRIAPFDVGAMAAEIHALADNEKARRELGRAAHAAAQNFGAGHIAKHYIALVSRLTAASTSDGAHR
jgi:glycosyltransferase involved in cell wall biosynthesis